MFSWLYDLIVDAFKDTIKNSIVDAAKSALSQAVDQSLNQALASMNLIFDLPLSAPFNISELDFTIQDVVVRNKKFV